MTDDEFDDLFRPPNAVADEGAALEGIEPEEALARLPRFLRLVLTRVDWRSRIVADCRDLAPDLLAQAARWADHPKSAGWQALAADLDATAAGAELPALRGLADAVRALSMSLAELETCPRDAARVVAALSAGLRDADARRVASSYVLVRVERVLIGWSSLVASGRDPFVSGTVQAHRHAEDRGKHLTSRTNDLFAGQADERVRREVEKAALAAAEKAKGAEAAPAGPVADADHVLVCPSIDAKNNTKVRDVVRGHEPAIGVPLRLVATPDLAIVRATLVSEFPYAAHVVDRLLGPMVGRRHVGFPPILVGPPGAGKTRMLRRLAELLGVGAWRTDAARADGNSFGGTDRRWYSAEPCHAFLACSRARISNALCLIDELDKSPVRADYGRLWDALLAFLEPESAARYPDPALQIDLDLSRVSYAATANSLTAIPSPLLDRFRVVEMPEPRASDLDALVPPLMAGILADAELDARWAEPLSEAERALVASHWRGGSVRRLRTCLGVVMRARDAARSLQ